MINQFIQIIKARTKAIKSVKEYLPLPHHLVRQLKTESGKLISIYITVTTLATQGVIVQAVQISGENTVTIAEISIVQGATGEGVGS